MGLDGNSMNNLTIKQMLELHHAAMLDDLWFFFWLSVAVHIFLGLVLPALRYGMKQARLYLRQNLQDHVEIGQMVSRKNGTNEY